MAPKDKKSQYNIEYAKTHVKQIKFNLSIERDADIISFLASLPNQQGYLKDLIRADMIRSGSVITEEQQHD